jgi:GTPase SAR1 family protein
LNWSRKIVQFPYPPDKLLENHPELFVSQNPDFFEIATTGNSTDVNFDLADIAADPMYGRSLNYLAGCICILVLFDTTKVTSFGGVQIWVNQARKLTPPGAIYVLIGTKSDIKNECMVDRYVAEELAQKNNMVYFETSAKDDDGVERIYDYFGAMLLNGDAGFDRIAFGNARDNHIDIDEESKVPPTSRCY